MKDYTIIIPTYNRPEKLKLLLHRYNLENVYQVIVADSSSPANKILNKGSINSVELDIEYLDHFDSDIHPWVKMAETMEFIDTEYCVFCADDDFIIPQGIEKAAEFLSNNPDYSVCHGNYFVTKTGSPELKKDYLKGKSIEYNTPGARVFEQLSKYLIPTFYGTHRTEQLVEVFRKVVDDVNLYLFGELLLSMLTLAQGKMKCLDMFYAVRNADDTPPGRCWPSLRGAIADGSYEQEYSRFRDVLGSMLIDKKTVDKAMQRYLKKYIYIKKSDLAIARLAKMLGRV